MRCPASTTKPRVFGVSQREKAEVVSSSAKSADGVLEVAAACRLNLICWLRRRSLGLCEQYFHQAATPCAKESETRALLASGPGEPVPATPGKKHSLKCITCLSARGFSDMCCHLPTAGSEHHCSFVELLQPEPWLFRRLRPLPLLIRLRSVLLQARNFASSTLNISLASCILAQRRIHIEVSTSDKGSWRLSRTCSRADGRML